MTTSSVASLQAARFLAVWCQFAMTIFYYPSLLAFVASTLAYVINPALAANEHMALAEALFLQRYAALA
jgi:hypothetical protein